MKSISQSVHCLRMVIAPSGALEQVALSDDVLVKRESGGKVVREDSSQKH